MTRILLSLALLFAAASFACAQDIPASPVATPTAAPQPTTLWSFLGISKDNMKACRQHLCEHPMGQMLNAMTQPLSFATGGLITPLCPDVPSEDALKDLANSNASPAEQAAAAIKADVAGAAARIAAIRYLATVPCHYYPEAEEGLIAGLRADRVECVRYAAAVALGQGCCCTKKTIAALTIAAEGSSKDGNPSETSDRVKAASLYALNMCLAKTGRNITQQLVPPELPPETNVPPLVPPEQPPEHNKKLIPIAYYKRNVQYQHTDALVQRAARVLAESVATGSDYRSRPGSGGGLFQMWGRANELRKQEETDNYYEAALVRPPRKTPMIVRVSAKKVTPRASIRFTPPRKQTRPVALPTRQPVRIQPVPVQFPQGRTQPIQRVPSTRPQPAVPIPVPFPQGGSGR